MAQRKKSNSSRSGSTRGTAKKTTGTRKTTAPTSRGKHKKMNTWKPGSQAAGARNVAAPGDFGVPVGTERTRDRDYVTRNTKRSDRGTQHPASHEHDGDRSSGAGGNYSGPGSSSGGDIDPDITGVGFGGSGVSQAGPDDQIGADESDGTSNEFASPVPPGRPGEVEIIPAQRRNQRDVGKVGGSKRVRGSVVSRAADVSTGRDAQGADAATNPTARGDDSFVGEISSGEASGDDLAISPSSDTQGARRGDNQIRGTQKDVRGDDDGHAELEDDDTA